MINLENGNYFKYETSGKFSSDDIWTHPTRLLYSYELIFVLDGIVFIEEDKKQYKLSKNNIIILEPNKYHGGFAESTPPVSFYWLHFQTNMPIPFKIHTDGEYYDLKYLLKKILHISNTPSYTPDSAEALALTIFYELLHIGCSPQVSRRALIKEIAEYVRINISSNLTVSGIAQHFNYNTDYLGKLFKNNYGIGLKDYITAEKIKKAKDMLLTSNLSIKEISVKLGFSHENLFIKFFIYHEKLSPTCFRNMYFNTHMNNS